MAQEQSKQSLSNDDDKSELEEGQVSSDESSDSSDSEFNDGYDENLMGDEDDQARLQALSEKERETEIFKRSERRDALRRRWEIEQKLRQVKRAERAKDKTKPKVDKKKKEEKRKKNEQEKTVVQIKGTLGNLFHFTSGGIHANIFLCSFSYLRKRRFIIDSSCFHSITFIF